MPKNNYCSSGKLETEEQKQIEQPQHELPGINDVPLNDLRLELHVSS